MRRTAAALTAIISVGVFAAETATPEARATTPGPDETARWRFFLSADALPFASHGFSGFVHVEPPGVRRWIFGAVVSAYDAPSIVSTLLVPANAGFGTRHSVIALSALYLLETDPLPAFRSSQTSEHGLFVGGIAGVRLTTISRADTWNLSSGLTNVLVGVVLGELWFPFGRYIYLAPAIGVATAPLVSGYTTIGGHSYREPPVAPLLLVPLGIRL